MRPSNYRVVLTGLVCLWPLLTAGCGSVGNRFDNVQLVESEARIEAEFRADRVETAERLVSVYERRLPGPGAQAMLGRARWRTGHLLEAEAMFRRGSVGGIAEGRLGLARAEASRGRWDQARALAEQASADPAAASRASRFLAGVALATGDVAAAVDYLAAAAAAESSAERAGILQQQSAALAGGDAAGTSAGGAVDSRGWSGATARLRLERADDGTLLVPVEVNGVSARLRLRLDEARSSLTSVLAADAGVLPAPVDGLVASPVVEVSAALRFGDLTARRQVLRVVDDGGPGDGTLGFDILGSARWLLELDRQMLTLASTAGSVRGTTFDLPSLRQTHWARARVLRDGLAAQLIVLPRLQGRVVSAQLRLPGLTTADQRLFAADSAAVAVGSVVDEPALLELRLGGWRTVQPVGREDLYPRADADRVVPQMLLGADVVGEWTIRWLPQQLQLVLTEVQRGERSSPGPARIPLQ